MNVVVRAKEGFEFGLTELGSQQGRIRAKYEDRYKGKNQYKTAVPVGWVEKGWVKEVPKNG